LVLARFFFCSQSDFFPFFKYFFSPGASEKPFTTIDEEETAHLQFSIDTLSGLVGRITANAGKHSSELTILENAHVAPIKTLLSSFDRIHETLSTTNRSLDTKFTKRHGGAIPEEKGQIKELYDKEKTRIEDLTKRAKEPVGPLREHQTQVEGKIQKFKSEISGISAKYSVELNERKQSLVEEKQRLEETQRKLISEAQGNHQKAVEAGREELAATRKKLESLKAAMEDKKKKMEQEAEEDKKEDESSDAEEAEEADEEGGREDDLGSQILETEREMFEMRDERRMRRCREAGGLETGSARTGTGVPNTRNFSSGPMARGMQGGRGGAMPGMVAFSSGGMRGGPGGPVGRGGPALPPPPPPHLQKFVKFLEGFGKTLSAEESKLEAAEEEAARLKGSEGLDSEGAKIVGAAESEIQKISEEYEDTLNQKIQKDREQKRSSTSSRRQELAAAAEKPAKIRAACQDSSKTFLKPVSEKLLNSDVDGAYAAYLEEREKPENRESPSFYIYNARLFHEVSARKFFQRQNFPMGLILLIFRIYLLFGVSPIPF
jgi:hypothetical protein